MTDKQQIVTDLVVAHLGEVQADSQPGYRVALAEFLANCETIADHILRPIDTPKDQP